MAARGGGKGNGELLFNGDWLHNNTNIANTTELCTKIWLGWLFYVMCILSQLIFLNLKIRLD